jgi:hypothetical protein
MNPELRRYIWCYSRGLMLALPPILMVLLLLWVSAQDLGGAKRAFSFIDMLFAVLLNVSAIVLIFWPLATAVSDEIKLNTWDFQRIAGQKAGDLFWGKLAGAGLYGWYTAMIVAGAYSLFTVLAGKDEQVTFIVVKLLAILLGSFVAFSVGVYSSISQRAGASKSSLMGVLVGAIFAYAFYSLFLLLANYKGGTLYLSKALRETIWFGYSINSNLLILATMTVLAAWLVAAAYTQFKRFLGFSCGPQLSYAFNAFVVFYMLGFSFPLQENFSNLSRPLSTSILLFTGMTVFAFMYDHIDHPRYLRWLDSGKTRKELINSDAIPRWFLPFLIATILAVMSLYFTATFNTSVSWLTLTMYLFLSKLIILFHGYAILPVKPVAKLNLVICLVIFYFALFTIAPAYNPFIINKGPAGTMYMLCYLLIAAILVTIRFMRLRNAHKQLN